MGTSELLDHSIIERFISVPRLSGNRARASFLGFFRSAQNCQFPLTPNPPCGNFLNTQADLGGSSSWIPNRTGQKAVTVQIAKERDR
jgi:hypothetical protein